jgi:hypothetical protein
MCSLVSFTSLQDVPKLALPAILDPSFHETSITVAGSSHTWNEVIAIAEKIRGKSITKNYFDSAKIKALIAEQKDQFAIFGLTLAGYGVFEPKRGDFSTSAYNVTHASKFADVKPLSVAAFLESAIKK